MSNAPGWTGNGSAGFALLGTPPPSPNPATRGSASGLLHPLALALTLAGRYSDRSFGTIDNSDPNSHTFQGFDGYMVLDVRAHYWIDNNWSASAGVDNLNNDKYFLYHPFPQRSFVMEIHYAQ